MPDQGCVIMKKKTMMMILVFNVCVIGSAGPGLCVPGETRVGETRLVPQRGTRPGESDAVEKRLGHAMNIIYIIKGVICQSG